MREHPEISDVVKVSYTAVHRDLEFLRQQAQRNIQKHIHEVIPEEYQRSMTGMKRNLKRALEIGESSSDPKLKLEAIRIANDCHKFIMDHCTNAGIVSDALKYVTHKQKQLDALKMLDEIMQASEKETT
jgi:hypothetical protein